VEKVLGSFAGKLKGGRKGFVLFLSVFVIGVMAAIAVTYTFVSRQGKLLSRRMFWSETAYFLSDSALEEAFFRLKRRPNFFRERLLNNPGQFRSIKALLTGLTSLNKSLDFGLSLANHKVRARVLPVIQGKESGELEFQKEVVGVLEIEVTLNFRQPGRGSGTVIRRVRGRREFRWTKLFGVDAMTDYLVFLKRKASNPGSTDLAGVDLTLRRGQLSHSEGKIYLGGKENETHILRPSGTSSESVDGTYLSRLSVDLSGEVRASGIESYRIAEQGGWNSLLLDSIWWDPRFKNIVRRDILERRRGWEHARSWLRSYFNDVPLPEVIYRFDREYSESSSVYNLDIESPGGQGLPLEGKVVRQFAFFLTSTYPEGGQDLQPQEASFRVLHEVPSAGLFEADPMRPFSQWPLFQGDSGSSSDRDRKRRTFLAYTRPAAYCEIYPELGSLTPWESFLQSKAIEEGGELILNLDGITGLMGDVLIQRNIRFSGQGVLIVMGKIVIQAGIERDRTDPSARLMLISRSRSGFQKPIQIQTGKPIEAYLQAHSFKFPGKSDGSLSALKPLRIYGGLSLDSLAINDLPEGSLVEYDPRFSKAHWHLTLGTPLHFYKVFSRE
jgi:hypothetical protein